MDKISDRNEMDNANDIMDMENSNDINDMKAMWQNLNKRLSHLEDENKMLMQSVMRSNYLTTQEKLVRKYLCFIGVEFFMIIYITLFLTHNPLVNEKYRLVTLIYWVCFFLIEMAFDGFLLNRIKSINVYDSPIKEVSKTAASNWKIHKIGIAIGLPLAFGAIFLFALVLDANEFTIFGMLVGGIIGLIIGINQLFKFKEYYNLLQTSD